MNLTQIIPSISVYLNEHSLKALIEDALRNHFNGYSVSDVHFSFDREPHVAGEQYSGKVKAKVVFNKKALEDPYTH